jgi:hypothetical protein
MAIQTIDSIFVNGKNQVFGGYIYAVDYQASFGEAPSLLKLTLTNEVGSYNIGPSDLSLQGSPVLIQLGSNLSVYMYPISYELENSPKGKLLQVEYVDESVVYLDKKVVKLKARGVNNESWQNTIVVGQELTRIEVLGAGPAVASAIINTSAIVTQMRVTEVLYTFYQLIAGMQAAGIPIGSEPSFDSQIAGYLQTYAGNLREVLSAWCNDLGYGFYWENRQLNFIDLRNPANFTAVSLYANGLIAANKILSTNTSYTLRDTISRGCYSFFGKDGQPVNDIPSQTQQVYSFQCLDMVNGIPWVQGYNPSTDPAALIQQYKVDASYYGEEAFVVSTMLQTQGISSTTGLNIDNVYNVSSLTDNQVNIMLPFITQNNAYSDIWQNYNWFQVTMHNLTDFNTAYLRYRAIALAWGNFYFYEMTSDEFANLNLSSSAVWVGANDPLTSVSLLTDIIYPLSPFIQNYNLLNIEGFLLNNPNEWFSTSSQAAVASTEGYAIIKANSQWTPAYGNGSNLINLGNTIIIEGPDTVVGPSGSNNGQGSTPYYDNNGDPVFYLGILAGYTPSFSSIQKPQIAPIQVSGKALATSQAITNYFPRIEYEGYIPPPTLNVNKYQINFTTITEDQIVSSASTTINRNASAVALLQSQQPSQQNTPNFVIWSNNFNGAMDNLIGSYTQALSPRNFAVAFNLFGAALTFSQPGPFFSVSFKVPNINLVNTTLGNVTLGVQYGLSAVNISIGDRGIETTYTISTQMMKIRSPNVFFRYRYELSTKTYNLTELSSVMLQTPSSELSS